MALRRLTPLVNAANVAANSVATFNLPVDRRYHAVWLQYLTTADVAKTQALIAAEILRIDIKLNGNIVRSLKPAWIAAIAAFHGFPMQPGFIPLWFSEPWQRDPGSEDAGAWALRGNVTTFQIDVTFGAAVTPKLRGFTEDDEVTGPLFIKQTRQVRPSVSGVGITTINDFPVKGIYQNLYMFETAANDIKSFRLKVDNKELYFLTRDQANVLAYRYLNTPQAGLFAAKLAAVNRWDHGVPSHANAGGMLLNGGAYPITMEVDMAVANTFDMVSEFLTPYL
jgi:Viral coat protein P2 N-terminal domain